MAVRMWELAVTGIALQGNVVPVRQTRAVPPPGGDPGFAVHVAASARGRRQLAGVAV